MSTLFRIIVKLCKVFSGRDSRCKKIRKGFQLENDLELAMYFPKLNIQLGGKVDHHSLFKVLEH